LSTINHQGNCSWAAFNATESPLTDRRKKKREEEDRKEAIQIIINHHNQKKGYLT